MSRALGPRPPLAAGNAALAWVLLAAAWALAGLAWLAWAAARLAAALTGGRVLPFSMRWVTAVLHGRTAKAWPGTPTSLVAVTGAVLAAVLAAAGFTAWRIIARRLSQPGDPVAALSRDRSIRQLARDNAAEQGVRLRPSLAGARPGRLAPADIGLVLGRLKQPGGNGPDLCASWEDTLLAFMGPRSGKTTSLGIPYVLSAPGPVVATTNTADLWAATAEPRAATGSPCVGVRPAAHHRGRAALVVEPAGRADQRRGRAPARQPLRAHDRRRHQEATSGGRLPRNC